MPNIKSQKKRVITNQKSHDINVSKRSEVKTAVKKFDLAVSGGDLAKTELLFKETIGLIDAARLDGIYHRNTASRKISALAKKYDTAKSAAK